MRVVCTGSSGFIAHYVIRALEKSGHEVIGIDILTGQDITKPLPPIPNLDAVIHLAAIAAPRECDANPSKAFDINVNGTLQVLKLALESGAKKVVFSSSAHVYGISPRYMPTDETHPLALGNTYTTTKILGEQLCELYWENHRLPYTVLRLYNAYGPGQAAGYFIPDMIEKAKTSEIVLRGGDTTKDFVHVDDVARAFVAAVQTPYFVGPINIGTGYETPLSTIAAFIANAKGAKFSEAPARDPRTRMQADITLAKIVLGWEPRISILEGLDGILNAHQAIAIR